MTTLEAASHYLERGLLPLPIPTREKKPNLDAWPSLRLTNQDLPKYFNGKPSNVGLILGDDYGTTDIDLDCSEALAAAGELLPETAMIFGRHSKPASHYFYRCDPPVRSKRFLDPLNKACIVELRCRKADGTTGLQTVVPPSIHPSGEAIRFEPGFDREPSNVDAGVLQGAVAKVAAAALFARHWPAEKSGRNETFLSLAGALARGGWALEQAIPFHRAIYCALWGPVADFEACRAEVLATYEKHQGGFRTTGRRSLAELVDKCAVSTALSWLGLSQAEPVRSQPAAARAISAPKSINMEDLMDDPTITVPELLIEGFIPRFGLGLLGGRPKDGKTWFACEVALSVVTGQALGGWLRVNHPGRVHLWALEDQFPITKDKVTKLLRGAHPDGLRDLRVFAEMPQPILRGGDQLIRAALQEHPAELVILDSLFKLSGASQPQYDISQRDYDVIDRVRAIAIDHKCCVLVIMHTKKGAGGGNPIENLLGTSGTPAAADVVAELKRFRQGGKLTVVGRCVPMNDFDLVWHGGPDEWGWTIQAEGEQAGMGETSEEVLAYLEAQGSSKPSVVATALRKPFGAVWQALLRLEQKQKVSRTGDKKWGVAR